MQEEMEMRESRELLNRLESAATLLERTLGWLEEKQEEITGQVEKISATVEMSKREEELASKLADAERQIEELRAAREDLGVVGVPRVLQSLRRTLPSSAVDMLAKNGIGESAVDVRTLDAALSGLSLEQRIAVKSQLRRAGAVA